MNKNKSMPELVLFGTKGNFAIEIEATKKLKIFKLCFWVRGLKTGLFTRSATLNDSIKSYRKYIIDKESYYLDIFDKMSAVEISFYLSGRDPITSEKNVNPEEVVRRIHFCLNIANFGMQFLNSSGGLYFLYKFPNVIFVNFMEKSIKKAFIQEVSFDDFRKVFEEYISYCESNNFI